MVPCIHAYVEALQKLAKMAWPLLDSLASMDQFLNGPDKHKLRVQVATTGARQIEVLMRIARSLEAVEGE